MDGRPGVFQNSGPEYRSGNPEGDGPALAQRIRQALDRGDDVRDISDDTGLSVSAVYGHIHRNGWDMPGRRLNDYRHAVQDMRPVDAVEYLLGVVDTLLTMQARAAEVCDGWGIRLTRVEARMMAALVARPGRVVSRAALYDAAYFDRPCADDMPGDHIVDVRLCNIRGKLRDDIGRIVGIRGRGWMWLPAGSDTEGVE